MIINQNDKIKFFCKIKFGKNVGVKVIVCIWSLTIKHNQTQSNTINATCINHIKFSYQHAIYYHPKNMFHIIKIFTM